LEFGKFLKKARWEKRDPPAACQEGGDGTKLGFKGNSIPFGGNLLFWKENFWGEKPFYI